MLNDEIVADIHRVREDYGAKFDHDIDAIYEDIRRQQAGSGREFISFPRNPPQGAPSTTPIRKHP